MIMTRLVLALSVALLLSVAQPVQASDSRPEISVTVVESETGQPIGAAHVGIFVYPPQPEDEPMALSLGKTVRADVQSLGNGRYVGRFSKSHASGTATVFVQAEGFSEWSSDSPISLDPNETASVAVNMARGTTLRGTVRDTEGKPVEGARLSIVLAGTTWCSWPHSRRVGSFHWPDEVVSDAEGRWQILGFPRGIAEKREGSRWVLKIQHDDFKPSLTQGLEQLPSTNGVVSIETVMRPGKAIHGLVVGPEGEPLVGIDVTAVGFARPEEPRCGTLDSRAKTDADGSFRLDGIDARAYTIRARSEQHAPSKKVSLHGTELPPEPLQFVMAPGARLRGRVLKADGRPAEALEVQFWSPETHKSATTDPAGKFEIAGLGSGPGRIRSFTLFDQKVEIPTPEPIEIRLGKTRELRVELTRAEDGRRVDEPGRVMLRGTTHSTNAVYDPTHDGSADFASFGQVTPGSFQITPIFRNRIARPTSYELQAGDDGTAVVIIPLERGFLIEGRVTDVEGQPVPGATVRAQGPSYYDQKEVSTDEDGRYEIAGLDPRHRALGSWYLLMISAPEFATVADSELFVRMRHDRTRNYELGPGGTVRGRITDADGQPLAGQRVHVSIEGGFLGMRYRAPDPLPAAISDAQGHYRLEKVPSGKVFIRASDQRHKLRVSHGETVSLDLVIEK